MGFAAADSIPKEDQANTAWVFSQRATLELTQYVISLSQEFNTSLD